MLPEERKKLMNRHRSSNCWNNIESVCPEVVGIQLSYIFLLQLGINQIFIKIIG